MDNLSEQEKMLQRVRQLALQTPENIRIIETNVDSDIQIEFFEKLQKIQAITKDVTPKELYSQLNDNLTSIERKKEILAILTIFGEVESYRLLEEYLKNPIDELKSWTYLAYQQARLLLKSKLLDEESIIYIASGLGGKEHRLRYIFALFSRTDEINETQKNIIKGEIEYFMKKNDGIIENLEYSGRYVLCTVLIPLYVNLVDLIQNITEEINQYGNFLEDNVFITNEKQIKPHDVEKYLISNENHKI